MRTTLSAVTHYLPTYFWIAFYLFNGLNLRSLPPSIKERYERHYTAKQASFLTKYLSGGALLSFVITTMSMLLELSGAHVSSNGVGLFCGVLIIISSLVLHVYVRLKLK